MSNRIECSWENREKYDDKPATNIRISKWSENVAYATSPSNDDTTEYIEKNYENESYYPSKDKTEYKSKEERLKYELQESQNKARQEENFRLDIGLTVPASTEQPVLLLCYPTYDQRYQQIPMTTQYEPMIQHVGGLEAMEAKQNVSRNFLDSYNGKRRSITLEGYLRKVKLEQAYYSENQDIKRQGSSGDPEMSDSDSNESIPGDIVSKTPSLKTRSVTESSSFDLNHASSDLSLPIIRHGVINVNEGSKHDSTSISDLDDVDKWTLSQEGAHRLFEENGDSYSQLGLKKINIEEPDVEINIADPGYEKSSSEVQINKG